MRIAGEVDYEKQAGESVKSVISPSFENIVSQAVGATNPSQKAKIRLMFEVEQ